MTDFTKKDIIKTFCVGKKIRPKQESQEFFASTNMALIKYWGKSNFELNLPSSPSVSITSKNLGTTTKIKQSDFDECFLNGEKIDKNSNFYKRVFNFIDLFREIFDVDVKLKIETSNNFPTSSGLASSASGFCALSFAINDFFDLNLDINQLATIARFGSGSACRSVFGDKHQYVAWENEIVKPVFFEKNDFRNNICVVVCLLSGDEKKTSSREGMVLTHNKSKCYQNWLLQTQEDYKKFFTTQDFKTFGLMCENNALSLHKAIRETGIDYFNQRTYAVIDFIQQQRNKSNLGVFLTIDAGANVCLFFQKQDYQKVMDLLQNSGVVKVGEMLDF